MHRSRVVILSAAWVAVIGSAKAEEDFGRGFHYCAPPMTPVCMTSDGGSVTATAPTPCDAQVQRFIEALAGYRVCLLEESHRAVTRGNDLLSAYRCRTGHPERCK